MTFKPDSLLVNAVHASPNAEERRTGSRPRLIVLHYTGMPSTAKAIHWLSHPGSKVSCHYVVGEEGAVTQLVPEGLRAWHAGTSHWAGESDINSVSIGIEIQNPGHEHGYPDFPPAQMQAIAALCGDIMRRRGIPPEGVLAHSDVAPGRKIDPGEKFDWAALARSGVGHWVAPTAPDCACGGYVVGDEGPEIVTAQRLLRGYGYGVETHGRFDERTRIVVRAFQQHFRQARADGRLDAATLDTLQRLVAALRVPATS